MSERSAAANHGRRRARMRIGRLQRASVFERLQRTWGGPKSFQRPLIIFPDQGESRRAAVSFSAINRKKRRI